MSDNGKAGGKVKAKAKTKAQAKQSKLNKKDSQLVIRINGALRDQFVSLCDDLDTSAAREIRGFIKDFVRKHEDGEG